MPAQPDIPVLIHRQSDLDALCSVMAECVEICLDTEFVRTNTYAPHLGLLQVAAGDLITCVDPLAEFDMGEFWAALFSTQRTCVLHAAKQDQEVLWFEQGKVIGNLLDTQICAGLLGLPAQIGYAGLVRELLGIELSKSETRTDWTRRPLSAAQISYAAEDVVHLPQIRKLLTEKLQALGRYQWALEDSAALSDTRLYRASHSCRPRSRPGPAHWPHGGKRGR